MLSNLNISLVDIFNAIIRYVCITPTYAIISYTQYGLKTIYKINNLIPKADCSNDKLGGHGKIAQEDETILKHSIKIIGEEHQIIGETHRLWLRREEIFRDGMQNKYRINDNILLLQLLREMCVAIV